MSMNFLLGVPGKLKTLLDRWTSEKAGYLDTNITSRASSTQVADIQGSGFASGTDSLKVLSDNIDLIKGTSFATGTDSLKILSDKIDVIDANVDSINADVNTTISSRASATALQTVDNNVDTILSRVPASVATNTQVTNIQGTGFSSSTDSLKVISDLVSVSPFNPGAEITFADSINLKTTVDVTDVYNPSSLTTINSYTGPLVVIFQHSADTTSNLGSIGVLSLTASDSQYSRGVGIGIYVDGVQVLYKALLGDSVYSSKSRLVKYMVNGIGRESSSSYWYSTFPIFARESFVVKGCRHGSISSSSDFNFYNGTMFALQS